MKKNGFEFNYVAPTKEERKEIESIRNNYVEKKPATSKLQRLRNLDAKVKNIPIAMSLMVGCVGALIFGLGLAMILEWQILTWGIVVALIGLVPVALAYPIYTKLSVVMKAKYSEEIIKLSDELLNDEKIDE